MKLLTFLFIIILLSNGVSALGITGNHLTVKTFYEQGKTLSYDYTFTTDAPLQDYQVIKYHHKGYDLRPYIQTSQEEFLQVPPNSAGSFSVTLNFFDERIPPGEHESRVMIRETLAGEGTIGAKASVGIRYIVVSLYPTEYIDWTLQPQNANIGEEIPINAILKNWGVPDILDAKINYKIYDSQNNLVKEKNSDRIIIESKGQKNEVTVVSSEGLVAGDYKVIAKLTFVDQTQTKEGKFRLGEKKVHIRGITSSFVPNAINKVNVHVESGWNEEISEVKGKVEIYNKESKVSEFKLQPEGLKKWEEKNIVGYFDTKNIPTGEYTAKIFLEYEDSRSNKEFNVEISENSEASTVSQIPGKINLFSFQAIIIALLIIILGFNVFYLIKKKVII